MKVLFLITGLGVGGAERQVVDIAQTLASRGVQTKIAFLTGDPEILPLSKSIEIVQLGSNRSFVSMGVAFFKFIRLVLDFRPDVVHSHMFHSNILARLSRLFVYVPKLVCTAHSTNEGGRIRMLLYRCSDFLCDVFTNVSKEAVRQFEIKGAVPKGKMQAILNGIDTEKFYFDKEARRRVRAIFNLDDEQVFLAVGRLVEIKGYPNLLTAFAKLSQENNNYRLWVVGDGILRDKLEQICCELHISDKVNFLGIRHDVEDLMRGADIFVLSSRWEGFGLVIAEAMATERIVVATDCGGVAEVVGDCGYLIPVEMADELAQAMSAAALLSTEEKETIGQSARERILARFSLQAVVDQWMNIYKK